MNVLGICSSCWGESDPQMLVVTGHLYRSLQKFLYDTLEPFLTSSSLSSFTILSPNSQESLPSQVFAFHLDLMLFFLYESYLVLFFSCPSLFFSSSTLFSFILLFISQCRHFLFALNSAFSFSPNLKIVFMLSCETLSRTELECCVNPSVQVHIYQNP